LHLKAQKKYGLIKGQVGTVVEELGNNFVEVEFMINKDSEPKIAPIPIDDLILLHFEFEAV